MKAKVKAAQQDVDAGKVYVSTDRKNIITSKGILEKAKDAFEKAESKLKKDIISEQQSESELAKTVQTLNRVHQEQSDTLAGLEARTAPPPVTSRSNNNNNNEDYESDQLDN